MKNINKMIEWWFVFTRGAILFVGWATILFLIVFFWDYTY